MTFARLGVYTVLWVISAGSVIQPVSATAKSELDDQAMQVRELLRLEQQQLRMHLEAGQGLIVPNELSAVEPIVNKPKLAAIYGVGKRLLAEFHSEDLTYLYIHNQEFPIGYVSGADVYRLVGITDQCVTLKRRHDELTQCLHLTLNKGKH